MADNRAYNNLCILNLNNTKYESKFVYFYVIRTLKALEVRYEL